VAKSKSADRKKWVQREGKENRCLKKARKAWPRHVHAFLFSDMTKGNKVRLM